MNAPKTYTALKAVTATTTSEQFYIGDFKRVALLFRRAAHAAGSTSFSAKLSFDTIGTVDPVMTADAMLIVNVENDNTETNFTHSAAVVLAANGDAFAWLDPNCMGTHISITATETTDGTHSAYIIGWE